MLVRFVSYVSTILLSSWYLVPLCAAQDLPAIFPTGVTAPPFPGLPTPDLGTGTLPERLALIIGIDHYESGGALPIEDLSNAEQDAEDLGKAFHSAGFYTYYLTGSRQNRILGRGIVTRNDILTAIDELNVVASKSLLRSGRSPVVLLYFAGHGMNIKGEDYLLPSDFAPGVEEDVEEMGLSIRELEKRLSWGNPTLRIIIADACRTQLPISLLHRSQGEESVAPVSGLTSPTAVSGSEVGINDEVIAFATLKGQPAKDAASPTGHNGAFARALLDSISQARAISSAAGARGDESTIEKVLENAGTAMKLDQEGFQVSEYVHRSAEFQLFPTEADYGLESFAWRTTENNIRRYITSQNGPISILVNRGFYCFYTAFIKTASFYSFYGAAGLRERSRYGSGLVDCDSVPLSTQPAGMEPPDFQKPIDGHWKHALSRQGHLLEHYRRNWVRLADAASHVATDAGLFDKDAPPLTLGAVRKSEILSQTAKAELTGFDDTVLANDLAVVHSEAILFRDNSLSLPSEYGVHDNDLVQIIALSPGDTNIKSIKVQTSNGHQGFLDQRYVDHPSIIVSFNIEIENANAKPQFYYDIESVDPVIRSGLLGSMLVQFPQSAKLQGFVNANIVAQQFLSSLDPKNSYFTAVLPSVGPINDSNSRSTPLKVNEVKVTLTLVPFDRSVRQRFVSPSGLSVDPTLAVSLDQSSTLDTDSSVNLSGDDTVACVSALHSHREPRGEWCYFVRAVLQRDSTP